LIEARNSADNAVYTAEKTLRDFGDKIPEELKSEVEAKAETLRSLMESEDVDALSRATDDLMQSVQQIGAAAYQQSEPQAGAGEPGEEPQPETEEGEGDEDVVDGEFRNV
jgi:molecular chaperone DnaK